MTTASLTAGDIALVIIKILLIAIPFIAMIVLLAYFERPVYAGKPGAVSYILKGMGLFFLGLILATLNAMALLGVFKWKILIGLIPAAIYVLGLALAMMLVGKIWGPKPSFPTRDSSKASSGFIDSLFAARREYSDFCGATNGDRRQGLGVEQPLADHSLVYWTCHGSYRCRATNGSEITWPNRFSR